MAKTAAKPYLASASSYYFYSTPHQKVSQSSLVLLLAGAAAMRVAGAGAGCGAGAACLPSAAGAALALAWGGRLAATTGRLTRG